jgi:hypothetical protein
MRRKVGRPTRYREGKGGNRRGRYGRGWKGEEERGGRDFANNNHHYETPGFAYFQNNIFIFKIQNSISFCILKYFVKVFYFVFSKYF